ncbi:TIGR03619 family F420-dependent LLM class oxidoreductase [Streptomyces sp. NPDC002896]|uniref:TIGR03619 family F420-dependent LLM class oxidoreductase n=1 Tax=Streptomyces sp. NPDC002896 TaxID=3154438 RepID=UPI0033226251
MTVNSSARLALTLPVAGQVYGSRLDGMLDAIRHAEDVGVDTVVAADHVVMGNRLDRYPWGTFAFAEGAPWYEPLTVLTSIAAVTSRLRLATGILIAGLRPPALLAKTAATLDVLSRGRLELGVGTGWQREEYDASGYDFGARAQRLDDTIGACRALWAGGPADFASETVTFSQVRCDPQPVQDGGPGILFAGPLTKRNLRRIRTLGNGWIPIMGESGDGVRKGIALLRKQFAGAGRDPETLRVRVPLRTRKDASGASSVEATLEQAAELAEYGVTEVSVVLAAFAKEPEDVGPFLERLGKAWGKAR